MEVELTDLVGSNGRWNALDQPSGADAERRDADLVGELGIEEPSVSARYELPGRFWLPLSAAETNWKGAVREAMEQHRSDRTQTADDFD